MEDTNDKMDYSFRNAFTLGVPPKEHDKVSKIGELWRLRLALGALAIVLMAGLCAYFFDYFNDPLNFTKQAWSFGVGMIAALCVGLNVGYINHYQKNLWTVSDVVWISMTVFVLSRMLAPVEGFVFNGRIKNASVIAAAHYDGAVHKTEMAVMSACSNPVDPLLCSRWKAFRDVVQAKGLAPENVSDRIDLALPGIPPDARTHRVRTEIEWSRDQLRKARSDEAAARKEAEDINIVWPYANLVILIIALGLRAGKTGAEFAKNKIDREKERAATPAKV